VIYIDCGPVNQAIGHYQAVDRQAAVRRRETGHRAPGRLIIAIPLAEAAQLLEALRG
jgi:hypothetical protein